MTLLSNIFRANNTITEEGKKIEITIRSLSMPELAESPDELTLDAVFAERDRLLDRSQANDGAGESVHRADAANRL